MSEPKQKLRLNSDSDAAADSGAEESKESLSATLLTLSAKPLFQLGGGGEKPVRLLPKDIDREVRSKYKGVMAPDESKIGEIAAIMRTDLDTLRRERDALPEDEPAPADEDGLEAALSDPAFANFAGDYDGSFRRWIEKQRTVDGASEGLAEIGEVLEKAVDAVEAAKKNAAAAEIIRYA